MDAVLLVLTPPQLLNEAVPAVGRAAGNIAVALMAITILVQMFYRYVEAISMTSQRLMGFAN
ncbi:MAG: hypothetical protein V2I76_07150 [Roseobacter sp.]|jgi:hypothetical protein|nr:hypothetical protein [Roseobacter sp.]